MKNDEKGWIIANDAHTRFGVDRSWLREKSNDGSIRKRTLEWTNGSGELRVKFLYSVEDIYRTLESAEG